VSKGRKAHEAEYCTQYHCAGDCGKRGHGVPDLSRYRHKKLALAAFDELESDEQRKLREQRAEVERKAREAL
jgi:hypothetical protein